MILPPRLRSLSPLRSRKQKNALPQRPAARDLLLIFRHIQTPTRRFHICVKFFTEAISHPQIAALSIATRCDCLSEEVLDLLEELNNKKPVWIELGLQTMHDDTLKLIHSGFCRAQYEAAVLALSARGIAVVTHLIFGLPGETVEMMRASVSYAASLPLQGVKLQLLHVLKNTELGLWYEKEPFPLFSLAEYCELVTDCIACLPPSTVIHRLTGDGPRSLLLAPLWSTDKKRVLNTIQKNLREKNLWQGKYFQTNGKEGSYG